MQELNCNIIINYLSAIAPKALNKIKLKQILLYQCDIYEKLIKENPKLEALIFLIYLV